MVPTHGQVSLISMVPTHGQVVSYLLELHIKGWQTFNINLYFTNVSYQYHISANDLLLVWLFVSINHIFAYLMELEGISTVDLYTKTYFMP
jgi:hypothetical protein